LLPTALHVVNHPRPSPFVCRRTPGKPRTAPWSARHSVSVRFFFFFFPFPFSSLLSVAVIQLLQMGGGFDPPTESPRHAAPDPARILVVCAGSRPTPPKMKGILFPFSSILSFTTSTILKKFHSHRSFLITITRHRRHLHAPQVHASLGGRVGGPSGLTFSHEVDQLRFGGRCWR
jgi:hypothetical protein